MSTCFSLPFLLSLPLFPLPCLSVSLLPGGGVGAAKVAGSNVVPALPESGQSESELSEVEGGAQATGNQLLLAAKARPGQAGARVQRESIGSLLSESCVFPELSELGGK